MRSFYHSGVSIKNTPFIASRNGAFSNQAPRKQKIHNFCFVGGTGNGKSSTINNLLEAEQAKVGKGRCSETKNVQKYVGQDSSMYFDMPGFGDTSMTPEEITQILQQFVDKMWVEAIRRNDPEFFRIDAFVLVIKCSPRMASLSQDLDALSLIFGPIALQSTILLLIHSNDRQPKEIPSDDEIVDDLKNSRHLMDAMNSAGRGPNPNEWFVNWSNFDEELFPNQRKKVI